MNILEIVVAVIMLIYILRGIKNGLILTVCSFLTLFVAIGVTQIITPEVSSRLRENEKIVSFLTEQVDNVLFDSSENEEIKYEKSNSVIEGLGIPEVIKDGLIANNIKKTYQSLGVSSVEGYVSLYISYSIINCITYVIVFLVSIILLKIIVYAINLVSKLPVINTLNKFGGMVIGLFEGVIIVWIGFIVITMLGSTQWGIQLYDQINKSIWLSYLYNNNLILNTLWHFTKSVI